MLDHDSSHTALASRRLARALGIHLWWLPKQCPQLNPVEHLWRALKTEIAANRQFANIQETLRYAEAWVQQLSPQEALRKSGLLSPTFWLHRL